MADLKPRVLFCVVALAMSRAAFGQANLEITLKQSTPDEARTRDQLRRLLATYDVSPWIYTTSIVIDERAIPFSHPVLTLHTRHAKDDDLLLSTFIHEQLHWFLAERHDPTELAIADLRKLFPTVPALSEVSGQRAHAAFLQREAGRYGGRFMQSGFPESIGGAPWQISSLVLKSITAG